MPGYILKILLIDFRIVFCQEIGYYVMMSRKIPILILLLSLITAYGGCAARKEAAGPVLESTTPADIASQHSAYEHFMSGILYQEAHQYEPALEELKMALALDPRSLEINYELASLLYQTHQFEAAFKLRNNVKEPDAKFSLLMGQLAKFAGIDSLALKYFRMAANFEPDNYSARQFLSTYFIEKNQPDSALIHLKKMVQINPEDSQASALLGQVYSNVGKYDSATVIFETIIKDNPYDRAASAGLGAVYQSTGQVEKALEIYTRIADRYPTDLAFQSMKFNIEISMGKIEAALSTGQRVLQLAPDNREFLLSVVQLYLSKNDFQSAENAITTYIEATPQDQAMKLLFGRVLISDSKFETADSLLMILVTENDSLSEVYILQALSLLRQEKVDHAIELLQGAIPKVGEKELLYSQIGNIYNSQHRYKEAISFYEKAHNERPDNPAYKMALAEASDKAGDFRRAEKILKELISAEPENATALNNLAYMYINRDEKLDKAESYLRRALKLDADNGAFLDSYGWLLYKKGKPKEALTYVEKALDKIGSDPEVFDHLGDIYRQLKNYDKSMEYYHKALELSPDNEAIKIKINSLPSPADSRNR